MEIVAIILLSLVLAMMIWLFLKIKKHTENESKPESFEVDAGSGKTKTLYLKDVELIRKYKESYLWACRVFGVHSNVFDEVEDKCTYHRMLYKTTYAVYKYPTINKPRHDIYDSMKSVIISGSGWEVSGAEDFMLEFIDKTEILRKDEAMHILGKKYDVQPMVDVGK